jgi:hypothetical protein
MRALRFIQKLDFALFLEGLALLEVADPSGHTIRFISRGRSN